MRLVKRVAVTVVAACLGVFALFALTGCDDVAAKWNHGKVTEEEVTNAATNEKANYTDAASWESFITNREYLEDDEDDAAKNDGKGTVAEYREYLVKELVKEQIVSREIEQRDITVDDAEVQERFESDAAMYEAFYGGGYAGTFGSILEMMGMSEEDYRIALKEEIATEKLVEAVTGITVNEEDSQKKQEAAQEKQDKAYEEWLDEQLENCGLQVSDCPKDLSYDPANAAAEDNASEESSSEDTEGSEE